MAKKAIKASDTPISIAGRLDELCARLVKIYGGGINLANFTAVVVAAMEIVESYTSLSGQEKRELVIAAVSNIIDTQTALSAVEKDALKKIISTTIEIAIGLSKHEFQINMQTTKAGCSKLFDCFKHR
jgi:hypothetical protein